MSPTQPKARLRVIGLVRETLSVSLANFPILLAVSLLAEIPLYGVDAQWGHAEYPQYPGMIFLASMAWGLRSGFAVHLVEEVWKGRRMPLTQSFRVGIQEALEGLNAVVILSGIRWFVFASILFPAFFSSLQSEALLGVRFVFLAVILWLMSVFGLSIPLDIRYEAATTMSLRRSLDLSRRHRGELAFLLGVFVSLELIAEEAIVRMVPSAGPLLPHLVQTVIGALGAPALAVVYFHLRRDEDSRSAEALAAVFE